MATTDIDTLIRKADTAGKAIGILMNARQAEMPDLAEIKSQIDPYEHRVMSRFARPDKEVKVNITDEFGAPLYDAQGNELTRKEYVKVARVAVSMQELIVNRAVSFLFGNDVQYTTDADDDKVSEVLSALKKVMQGAGERSHNKRLAREVFTATEAAEYWYLAKTKMHNRYGFPCEYKVRCALFQPTKGDLLYPYFNAYGDMEAFSRQFQSRDVNGKLHQYFETYTATTHYMWTCEDEGEWKAVEGYPERIVGGKIPIVYVRQDETEWNKVQTLIDRLETLLSNFADTNDYHASPKIFVTGDIRGWGKKGESGQIIEGEVGSSAQYLSWSQAPQSVQVEIETLLRLIHSETQTPDISFDAIKSIGAPSGVALKLMFMDAHLKVQRKLEYFSDALRRRASVVLSLLSTIAPADFASVADEIEVDGEVRPYNVTDDAYEMGVIATATGGKAVMSRKTAIQRLAYVDDVDEELKRIDEDESGNVGEDLVDAFVDDAQTNGATAQPQHPYPEEEE